MHDSTEKLKPLGDGVLVRLAKAEDTSKGGIIIPENAKEKPRRGEVLAVGPGRVPDGSAFRVAPEVKPGEVVLFSAFVGTPVTSAFVALASGDDLLLLRESDLLAVVEPAAASGLRAELERAQAVVERT